jgi:hypothetical protein
MRAEPFVQAELRRGEAVAEAFGQVQDYSLMRHKAAVEVQMSESLLAAEEEMMNAGQPPARKARTSTTCLGLTALALGLTRCLTCVSA